MALVLGNDGSLKGRLYDFDAAYQEISCKKLEFNGDMDTGFQGLSGKKLIFGGRDIESEFEESSTESAHSLTDSADSLDRKVTLEPLTSINQGPGKQMQKVSQEFAFLPRPDSSYFRPKPNISEKKRKFNGAFDDILPNSASKRRKEEYAITVDDTENFGLFWGKSKPKPPVNPYKSRGPKNLTSENLAPKNLNGFAEIAYKVSITSLQRFKGIDFNISPKSIGSGDFSEAFAIADGQQDLFACGNSKILFKRYQKELLLTKKNRVNGFVKNSVAQYLDLLKINFPVAKILNIETLETDGFFLVENIPAPFEITWNETTALESLSLRERDYLEQVKMMFQIAYNQNIPLDLSSNNVRINEQGQVMLIDLQEENEDGFKHLIVKHLRSFARGNEEIFFYLMPRKQATT